MIKLSNAKGVVSDSRQRQNILVHTSTRCVAGSCAFQLLEKMNQINMSFLEGDAPDGYVK
jgi:hypothetical protein